MDTSQLRARLDAYYREVDAVILQKQHPVSGLLPASTAVTVHGDYRDAWVRDNVYSILAVWGLARAYAALDDDGGRGYELDRRTVLLMRGLLRSMMAQANKVEAFKLSRAPRDALHAKYDTETGNPIVGDLAWGHLQIDATSLYLLMLAQMTTSGLAIVWTKDEVDFVQNLVYYIERAYRTPDFGIWERGAKSNHGQIELNASSLGMAKAALEALTGFNLYGPKGGQSSVIHVAPDNVAQADITLSSMLPRESMTKEVDAALLSVISYPAFAVHDAALVERVRAEIVGKLEGRYGLKRFLRDGHQTAVEVEGRAHYEPSELKQFENIESEWPLFFCYLYLDTILSGDSVRATLYEERLASVAVVRDGCPLLPELYYVPEAAIAGERTEPRSQVRVANENVPLVWAQSLYLLGRMLREGLIQASDIDPLGRRRHRRPARPVVQILLLAENAALQAELAAHGVACETPEDIAPVSVFLAEHIAQVHGNIGTNERLGLTGRSARALKSLTTSRFYRLRGDVVVCLASFFTLTEFFLAFDLDFVVRRFRSELVYLRKHWTRTGRPTVTILLTRALLESDRTSFYTLMQEVNAGRVDDMPVLRGTLAELLPTAAFERVDDLRDFQPPNSPLSGVLAHPMILPQPNVLATLDPTAERALDTAKDSASLLARLAEAGNPYEQIGLLEALVRLMSLDAEVELPGARVTLRALVEEVYERAAHLRLWAVVRRAAGILGKVDGDLSLAVGAILVQHKRIQVGRSYSDASLVTTPIPERDLLEKIAAFSREDVRDRVLVQELILYIGILIQAHPDWFRDILTIRVGHLVTLFCAELGRERGVSPDEAYEQLMQLPPSGIQARLEGLLQRYGSLEALPQELDKLASKGARGALRWNPDLGYDGLSTPTGGWLEWRQHQGVVDRRPADFHRRVWYVFERTPALIIGDRLDRKNRMDSSVVLSDMTPDEQSFALWLDHLLNKIASPEYRQLVSEALSVLASFLEQHKKLQIQDPISLDAVIGHAVHLAFLDGHADRAATYNEHKAEAWDAFYRRSPAEASTYFVAALRHLLEPPVTA